MFGLTLKRSAPPRMTAARAATDHTACAASSNSKTGSSPSTVFTDTYNWSNFWRSATVTVTVDDAAPGYEGQWKWNYQLTNVSFDDSPGEGIENFTIPLKDPEDYGIDGAQLTVGNIETDRPGWVGDVGISPAHPLMSQDLDIWWVDETGLPIEIGQSANFSFTTVPTAISSGTGWIQNLDEGIAVALIGTVAAPVAPDPHIVTIKSDPNAPKDGLVSLREAVKYTLDHQDKGKTVTFGVSSPITLDPMKGQIVLGKDNQATEINISGWFTETITIQRDAGSQIKHRIFDVLLDTTVTLSNLELMHGKIEQAGGAVRSKGYLTISECEFLQNEAVSSEGGAIAAIGGSLDIVSASLFTGNSANQGGAIYIGQRVPADLSYSVFVLNSATGQFGKGGAIYIQSSTTANPTTVTISNVDVNGNVAPDRGGGIMVSEAAPGAAGTVLVLISTQIRNNVVTSASGKGGGVFFGAGSIALFGVTFSDNEANSGDGIYYVTGTTEDPNSFYFFNNDSWAAGPY